MMVSVFIVYNIYCYNINSIFLFIEKKLSENVFDEPQLSDGKWQLFFCTAAT